MKPRSDSRPAVRTAAVWAWHPPRTPRRRLAALPGAAWELVRRGTHHGIVRRTRSDPGPAPDPLADRWRGAEPLHLRGWVRARSDDDRRAIARTRRLFERLADGGDFEPEIWRRLGEGGRFVPAGASVDLGDEREIEKVHADEVRGGRSVARDLWAKLSWISRDERDPSLRIRFSFGSERLDDWSGDPRRARAADDFARAVFPETALVAENPRLTALVDRMAGRRVRFSERIVFANAPGGGAVFHHDAETDQLGVLYGQLSGRTAWLALPKRRLARHVAELAKEAGGPTARIAGTPARAMRALDRGDRPALDRLLNDDPRTTKRLVEAGELIVLDPGDALLLPSPGADDAAWHSVFALGARPSVAHSYGIFAKRR